MPEHLIIVAGRPGMGKSVLACQLGNSIGAVVDGDGSRLYDPTLFSLEMNAKENAARMIAELDFDESIRQGRAPLQYTKILKGRLSADEWERFVLLGQKLEDLGIKVYDEGKMTVQKMSALARARAQLSPRKPVTIIDNIQIIAAPERTRGGGRVEEITAISGELKAMAKRLGAPVIALSHLNRAVEAREDKRPTLADLRESGSIEQDADEVLFLYRPEYYLRAAVKHAKATKSRNREELEVQLDAARNVLEIDVAKNRSGPPGDVRLFVDVASNVVRDKKPEAGVDAPATLFANREPLDSLTHDDLEKRAGHELG